MMSKHRLLANLFGSASTAAPEPAPAAVVTPPVAAAAPAPAATVELVAPPAAPTALVTPPAAAAPAAAAADETIDVVLASEARAAVATATTDGRKTERERTSAVLNSASGKKHPASAAFMLNANPDATADAIIQHLDTMPEPVSPAAAAPAPAPGAITTSLAQTPKPVIAPNAPADTGTADAKALWEAAQASASLGLGMTPPEQPKSGVRPTGN
jgi:hypothetical protein